MIAICQRNLKIYFSNKITVFFSLLGALIVFALYLLFLRKNMLAQFETFPNSTAIVDFWVLGGILATTSLTTSFTALGQLVMDKTTNKLMDFAVSGQKISHLLVGYFLSACIISFSMQVAVLAICISYFHFQETIYFPVSMAVKTLGFILISALTATAINLVVCTFIKNQHTLRTISSMLGALSGFISTAYLPVGSFNGIALTIIKITPISYISSSFRRLFILPLLKDMPEKSLIALKEFLGIGYTWHNQLTNASVDLLILFASTAGCLFMVFLCSKKIKQITIS